MATESLSELIKTVSVGEDGDQAYVRLYGSQVKPCDFRRWYAQVKLTDASLETDEATVAKIKEYLVEELTVDEAFKDFCPDYVGPGEFSVAYTKQVMMLKAAVSAQIESARLAKEEADRKADEARITQEHSESEALAAEKLSPKVLSQKSRVAPVVPEVVEESPLEPAIVPLDVPVDVPSDVPVSDQTAV